MSRHHSRLSIKSKSTSSESHLAEKLALAIQCHQHNQLEKAEKAYRFVLKRQPDNPDALHFFGVLLHQTGHSDKAIENIKRALTIHPFYVDAWNNLGNVYKEIGAMQDAADAYRQVIAHVPDHPGALNNLGIALKHLERYEEALVALSKAAEISPSNSDVFQNLGNVYQELQEYKKASESYKIAIALNPKQKYAYHSLWRLLRLCGQNEAAGEVLEQWFSADPDNPIAQHQWAAWRGESVPKRASDAYIQQTFDRFAASFDSVLNKLDYRAPELVTEAVARLLIEPKKDLSVLDAGCGTGLCGPLLKPYADQLTGVDLSSGMLQKASGRDIYDNLVEADLVDYLEHRQRQFDLIVSADTLVYFGDLTAFMTAAAKALRRPGYLVFTVERCDESTEEGFKLNYHGRYAHECSYIEQVLTAAGLIVDAVETVILRKEAGQPVNGLLVSAILR
ncbi:MAG: tetratricopeptide repeat protein [Methylomicrobium sp.]